MLRYYYLTLLKMKLKTNDDERVENMMFHNLLKMEGGEVGLD